MMKEVDGGDGLKGYIGASLSACEHCYCDQKYFNMRLHEICCICDKRRCVVPKYRILTPPAIGGLGSPLKDMIPMNEEKQ